LNEVIVYNPVTVKENNLSFESFVSAKGTYKIMKKIHNSLTIKNNLSAFIVALCFYFHWLKQVTIN